MDRSKIELKDIDLKQVTGGYIVNADGTYCFKKGDLYLGGSSVSNYVCMLEIMDDYPSVSISSQVRCLCYELDRQGNLICEDGEKLQPVQRIITSCIKYNLK